MTVTAKAFGYCRLSRYDGVGTSMEKQRDIIIQTCQQRGWELAAIFEDVDVSGKQDSRPGLDEMLSRLPEIRGGALVFWKLDRVGRSVPRVYDVAQQCEDHGVSFVSATEQFDTSTAMGRAFLGLLSVFAAFERDTTADRMRATHAYRKSAGLWSSRRPYGWNVVEGRLVLDPEEWAVITGMARGLVSGRSYRELGREYDREHTSIRSILRSDRVLAQLDSTDRALADGLRATLRVKGNGEGSKSGGGRSLLAGIARCGVCGGPMKRSKRGKAVQYGCRDAGCVYVGEEWLDTYVEGKVQDRKRQLDEAEPVPVARPSRMDASSVDARLAQLEQDYAEDLLSRETYINKRQRLLSLRAEAQEQSVASGMSRLSEWDGLNKAGKRAVLQGIVENLSVEPVPVGQPRNEPHPDRIKLVFK